MARCGCDPGNRENGWMETRSEKCIEAERKAWVEALERSKTVISRIVAEARRSQNRRRNGID